MSVAAPFAEHLRIFSEECKVFRRAPIAGPNWPDIAEVSGRGGVQQSTQLS